MAKYKAYIYVRDNLQSINKEETHIAILVFKVFKALIAMVAKYRLKAQQLDTINIFCNTILDRSIYTLISKGFKIPNIYFEL